MANNYYYSTSTSGPSYSKTVPENKNLTVEFYKDGVPVKISGIKNIDDLTDILDTISVKQWEITW